MNSDTARRWIRRGLTILLALVVFLGLVGTALWIACHELAPDKLKTLLQTALSDFLGRPLTIERISCAPFPRSELHAFGVELFDQSHRPIVECPEVVARASALSLLKLQLGIEEVRFERPTIHLWYEKDGRLNVEHIVGEIAARPAVQSKTSVGELFLHRFTLANGRLQITDEAGAPPVVDGRVNGWLALKFSPLGLRGLPFDVSLDEGDSGARLEASGWIGATPHIDVRGAHIPARALSARLKTIGNCTGRADLRFEWTGGRHPSYDFSVAPAGLCKDQGDLPERLSGTVQLKRRDWLVDLEASGADTELHAHGDIAPGSAPINFDVHGPRARVESVIGWWSTYDALAQHADTASEPPAPSTAPSRAFSVSVAVSTGSFMNVALSSAAFEVHRGTDSVVRVQPINVNLLSGKADGAVDIRDGVVDVKLHGAGFSLDDVASVFGSTHTLSGRMALNVTGSVPVGAPVISSFTGHGEVWIEDFRLDRDPAIVKVLTSASYVRIEQRIKGEKREPFLPAKGNIQADLKDGVADVSKLWLENRTLRLGFRGKIDYVGHQIDGTMVVQALTAADQVINDIPVVRDLVLGKGKSLIPLWFRLQGPWSDPKARPEPVRSLETPILRIFHGLIDLPQELIDKVRGKD